MQDDRYSLVYLTLGNKFRITEGKYQHINLLQYLNLLITKTDIKKIDLPISGGNYIDEATDVFHLDVRCLCYIPNIVHEGRLVPNMEIIGGINLFTFAGNRCLIIDEVKAHQKYINEYVHPELSDKHSDFLKQNPTKFFVFYDDWNTKDISSQFDDEIDGDYSYLLSQFDLDSCPEIDCNPNRLGFYSWLFSDGLIIHDFLSKEMFAEGVDVTYSHEFSELVPIKKDNSEGLINNE